MIEHVAKAIYHARNGAACKPWSAQPDAHKKPYLLDAKAAISAMREPTPAMWDAFVAYDPNDPMWNPWKAMIDAALSPERGKVEA